jgi:hypothetical protein
MVGEWVGLGRVADKKGWFPFVVVNGMCAFFGNRNGANAVIY